MPVSESKTRNPNSPYRAPETAAQQAMQQPQSGPPSLTGGAGAGTTGPLPQAPGGGIDQPGSKSLASLVEKLQAAIGGASDKLDDAMAELSKAAFQADELLKQTGNPQYPAQSETPTESAAL